MRNGLASLLRSESRNLQAALRSLEKTLQKVIGSNGVGTEPNGTQRRRARLSAKARASLVLQGRYMGYMRQLKPRQKAQVRKIKEAKGVRVAIAKAKRLAAN